MSRSWSKGSTAAWRKTRAAVLAENKRKNQGRCTLQLEGCTGEADSVHHVLGRAVTGDDQRYLAAVCKHCNGSVGDPMRNEQPIRRVSSW
ncbi:hypothetical protein [Haloechinothrix salitolerans]|uniref:HNH endonuclease n=1 Tax=Haloechinothrix salitolerans TaxID=926830 RepID=A0ABW2BYH4_9PSEU